MPWQEQTLKPIVMHIKTDEMDVDLKKEEVEIDKPENEVEAASSSSNDDSDEEADADADMEESPRGRKSVSSLIAEMAIKNDQVMNWSKAQKEDEQKRLELSRLSPGAMAVYLKELETELYELSQQEARELSRSKHLRIFGNSRRRSSK